jgi:hypothetical protein
VNSRQDSQKNQISQILAAALEQHTLHNNKISIRAIMTGISLLLAFYGNPRFNKLTKPGAGLEPTDLEDLFVEGRLPAA